uniref:Uncharacterized protein n=1 Tax=Calidris pygmaea TaxID=425635 RepID=A0A8C3JVZ0_9CHAR
WDDLGRSQPFSPHEGKEGSCLSTGSAPRATACLGAPQLGQGPARPAGSGVQEECHSCSGSAPGRSPVCARSWITRALDCLKPLPQSGQTKGRSPTPQTWGLSSQCWRWWRRRALERLKRLPQSSQRKGRSSVWTSRWLLKSEWRLKEAWQRSQRKGRSSLCTTSWLKSSQARLKAFSQTPHWKGFSSTITSRISSSLTPLAPRFGWAGSPTAASSSSPTALPSTSLAVE